MYPIRKSRNIWSRAFLKPHTCNELCSAQYQIQHNSIRITYETGCLFPEQVEPLCVHVSDHDEKMFIDSICEVPREVEIVIDFPLKNPLCIEHTFEGSEPVTLSMVLQVFDDLYKKIYEEEEEQASKREFVVSKGCSDCDDEKYTEEYVHLFLNPSTEGQQCNICFEEDDLVDIELCKHSFHKQCILKWFNTIRTDDERKSNSCPLCRQPIIHCKTCRGTRKTEEKYYGSVLPYSDDSDDNRIETDGPYRIHTLYYEELYFKGILYDRINNVLRLLPYERLGDDLND